MLLGIPFAKPVGRFEHSAVRDVFDGEIDGTSMASACPQPSSSQYKDVQQSEDCLTLDIYMPIVSDANSLSYYIDALFKTENVETQPDVFFWIHGGSFNQGTSSEYSGFTQVDRGNIVVSINYRLGPLGFMQYYNEGTDIDYDIL